MVFATRALLILVTLCALEIIADCQLQELLKKKYEADDIVPDSLDEAPPAKLIITYPNGKEVDLGKELTPTEVKPEPKVTWEADPNKYYTLSKVDPDARSRSKPTYREFNHWLVVNIKGNDLSTGNTLTSYRGSGAPKGTGLHRYIFTVFEQPKGKITVNQPKMEEYRRNFSIRRFANQYGLSRPVAGNYYQAQWDSSVQ